MQTKYFIREPPIVIKKKTQEAKESLLTWKKSYFEVRAKIEASGRDARWEFDRKRLFERTDYMAKICEDIHEIAQVGIMSNFSKYGFGLYSRFNWSSRNWICEESCFFLKRLPHGTKVLSNKFGQNENWQGKL